MNIIILYSKNIAQKIFVFSKPLLLALIEFVFNRMKFSLIACYIPSYAIYDNLIITHAVFIIYLDTLIEMK